MRPSDEHVRDRRAAWPLTRAFSLSLVALAPSCNEYWTAARSETIPYTIHVPAGPDPVEVLFVVSGTSTGDDYPELELMVELLGWDVGQDTGSQEASVVAELSDSADSGNVNTPTEGFPRVIAQLSYTQQYSDHKSYSERTWSLDQFLDSTQFISAGSFCPHGNTVGCSIEVVLSLSNLSSQPVTLDLSASSRMSWNEYGFCRQAPEMSASLELVSVTPPEALLP